MGIVRTIEHIQLTGLGIGTGGQLGLQNTSSWLGQGQEQGDSQDYRTHPAVWVRDRNRGIVRTIEQIQLSGLGTGARGQLGLQNTFSWLGQGQEYGDSQDYRTLPADWVRDRNRGIVRTIEHIQLTGLGIGTWGQLGLQNTSLYQCQYYKTSDINLQRKFTFKKQFTPNSPPKQQ